MGEYGGEMGSKLGWLPVDGASGDYPYPLQGCLRSYAIALLPPPLLHESDNAKVLNKAKRAC